MRIVYTTEHKIHAPTFEVYEEERSAYPEVPDRIEMIARTLEDNGYADFIEPEHFSTRFVKRIHHPNYVKMLEKRSNAIREGQAFPSYFTRDTYAPITPGTYEASLRAVDTALMGAKLLKDGEKLVYSLCRPPGHHAEHVAMGGYCYFNNAAAAADYLSAYGKVAILDIDFHHGNGTQDIFYHRNDVLYVSLHADPNEKYPYVSGFTSEIGVDSGKGFTKNYPLPLTTTEAVYRKTLAKALLDIEEFGPDYLVLSAGFDTYIKDPIGKLGLDIPSYQRIGKEIATLKLPTLVIQEGGYMVDDLGDIALSLVRGLTH